MKLWRGQPDHDHWRAPFTPRELAVAWLGLGACFLILGLYEWFSPATPPFTGKWGRLLAWAHDSLGPNGPAIVFLVPGVLMGLVGAASWRRK